MRALYKFSLFLLFLSQLFTASSTKTNRTSFCTLHKQVEKGEIKLENALRGLEIYAATYFIPSTESHNDIRIEEMIFNELANRAGFTWNTTYKLLPHPSTENETFTTSLVKYKNDYDVFLGWWTRNLHRLSIGLVFLESWYDADTIIIQRQLAESYSMFSMFQPFTIGLWILIILTIILSAAAQILIEFLDSHSERKKEDCDAFFCYFQLTMGQLVHMPRTLATQILTLSTCFISLILIKAYTANLTSCLVMRSSSESQIIIKSITDVVANDFLTCALKGIVLTENFKEKFPYAMVTEYMTNDELFAALSKNGECDVAITTIETYKSKAFNKAINTECVHLEWVGRRVESSVASFTLADSEQSCTSLFQNVLDLHLLRMKIDGTIDQIWGKYRTMIIPETCQEEKKTDEKNTHTGRFNVLTFAGVFAFHFFILFISILYGFFSFYRSKCSTSASLKDFSGTITQFVDFKKDSNHKLNDGATSSSHNNNDLLEEKTTFLETQKDILELQQEINELQLIFEKIFEQVCSKLSEDENLQ